MKRKILVFDNYDSFTYNLVHYIKNLTTDLVDVYRNDEIPLADIAQYDKILLSPGPGIPDEAGLLKDLIKEYAATKSIMGVCLGVQAIAEVFGGTIINLPYVYHGVATQINILDKDELMFKSLPNHFEAGRYHSWVIGNENLPDCLKITCNDNNGQIMGIRHKEYDVRGVQFHPESVLTKNGHKMIENWLNDSEFRIQN